MRAFCGDEWLSEAQICSLDQRVLDVYTCCVDVEEQNKNGGLGENREIEGLVLPSTYSENQ